MIAQSEIAEYTKLRDTLESLRERFLKRKQELRHLLEETAALRKETLLALARANRLTRHLTGPQRQITALSYHLGEIKARIDRINQYSPALVRFPGSSDDRVPELQAGFLEACRSQGELKQKELAILRVIDTMKKNLLQLDLLELRCRELVITITKALEAFRYESKIINRNIYPFGIFSVMRRTLRCLWGKTYFSNKDMDHIAALGTITVHVLRIADSPAAAGA
ncbi:MAG: hypothetical protein FWC45_06065 [Treponema sp.]|nr:hypothetical protein [Treponema sp.]